MSAQGGAPWLLVVGAHRSGTSGVTGALGALGFALPGPGDRVDWPESNPEHWESLSLSRYNDGLLRRFGGYWDAPPDLPPDWERSTALDDVSDPVPLLAAAFGAGPSVWKDPRMCLLLDYWRGVLARPIAAVLVWRSPTAVARSLHQRDQMPLTDGLALWERYNRSALQGLDGVATYIVGYESVLQTPERSIGDLAGWIGSLEQFAPSAERWDRDAAVASITRGLQHHRPEESGEADRLVLDEQAQLARRLAALQGGHQPLHEELPCAEARLTSAVIRNRRDVDRAQIELERTRDFIETMRSSTSWRVTKPLRSISSMLHRLKRPH
jgi:hypothetical protein